MRGSGGGNRTNGLLYEYVVLHFGSPFPLAPLLPLDPHTPPRPSSSQGARSRSRPTLLCATSAHPSDKVRRRRRTSEHNVCLLPCCSFSRFRLQGRPPLGRRIGQRCPKPRQDPRSSHPPPLPLPLASQLTFSSKACSTSLFSRASFGSCSSFRYASAYPYSCGYSGRLLLTVAAPTTTWVATTSPSNRQHRQDEYDDAHER